MSQLYESDLYWFGVLVQWGFSTLSPGEWLPYEGAAIKCSSTADAKGLLTATCFPSIFLAVFGYVWVTVATLSTWTTPTWMIPT